MSAFIFHNISLIMPTGLEKYGNCFALLQPCSVGCLIIQERILSI
ncbi:hypothetical protein CLOSTMETH_03731 [[Clostridium] methylpentosum DSM 5476]|uniref:Uncharacterized protein n=1 Tax=[Clostridium] methylpentosum DSM 5476 TaxID=537013 RepID=C0EIN6_9FIRM|nr:hypothetical protein CLOSTMETH_03731 [[Clostridium] methylpentosum DSM 5476]